MLSFKYKFAELKIFFFSLKTSSICRFTMDGLDYEENVDSLNYMPQRNNLFEICQYEVSTILITK